MVSTALRHCCCAGITYAEPLGSDTAEERFTARCSVQTDIADNYVFVRFERNVVTLVRVDDDFSAGQSLRN